MINKETRQKRSELCRESFRIRKAMSEDVSYEKMMELKRKQNEIYKKWDFYNGFIKAQEKIK